MTRVVSMATEFSSLANHLCGSSPSSSISSVRLGHGLLRLA
jgi:hypothetical protein